MALLLTGAGGQVGVEIARLAAARGLPLHALTRTELDIADGGAVAQAIRHARPDGVINAAAYTAVDRAEAEPEAAFAVNRDGAAHLATACAAASIPLVHLSTDYVFDGTKGAPYTPDDPIAPLSVYGRSKADGEAAVRAALREHVIVRTAWVFSAHGHNFVRTMARLMQERDEVRVVADQFGHPTWAGDLARIALDLAGQAVARTAPWGTLHAAGQPLTSWHGFAEAVHASLGDRARATRVEPISTEAYPTPARRPMRVELDMGALALAGLDLPDWRPALDAVVAEIVGRA